MSEISELRRLLNINLDRTKELNKQAEGLIGQIEKLKKEDEVKPVFPESKGFDVWLVDVDTVRGGIGDNLTCRAATVGKTFRSKECAEKDVERSVARAYVIEAINKANGGDNGFKYGSENNLISFNHEAQVLKRTDFGYLQEAESCLYIRNVHKALSLLSQKEFREAYKTMLNIK